MTDGGFPHSHGAHRHTHLSPGHSPERRRGVRALKRALVIILAFMVLEFIGGLWTNSLALMADAGHMLTDAVAIGLSLFAAWIVRRPATPQQTYGYFRVEILAALVNGLTLSLVALVIVYHAVVRFMSPPEVRSLEMLLIATAGFGANLTALWLLHGSRRVSLNIRGAFLHVFGDLMGSVGTILAGIIMLIWGAYWVDPLVSLLVSILILISAVRLIRDSVLVLLEGTPPHVNLKVLRSRFCGVPGVASVHDLHVWTLTSGVHALTCHAVVEPGEDESEILERLSDISRDDFDIHHTTIQIERQDPCPNRPDFCN